MRGLRQQCRSLRTSLLDYQVATAAELEACWPGGAENALSGYDGWIECYALLKGLARRQERETDVSQAAREALAAAVRRAAARAPVSATLSIGTRLVYPKSAWALWFLQSLDAVVSTVDVVAQELASLPDAVDLRGLPSLTQGLAWRTWAWILTHDGVGLPFAEADAIDPPTWTEQLLVEDYLALYAAHRALHLTDTSLMAGAFPPEGGERSRLDLGGFLASYAHEHGVPPADIIRKWALPEVYASAIAAAESHRIATANAKRSREERA